MAVGRLVVTVGVGAAVLAAAGAGVLAGLGVAGDLVPEGLARVDCIPERLGGVFRSDVLEQGGFGLAADVGVEELACDVVGQV